MFKILVTMALVFAFNSNKLLAQNSNPATDTTITVKVKGVTCNNDLKTLSNNVKELKGVSECTPGKKGPVSVFKITYNPTLVDTKEIYKAIENTEGCTDPNDRPYKVKTR
jgi:copper chaperone CopZ